MLAALGNVRAKHGDAVGRRAISPLNKAVSCPSYLYLPVAGCDAAGGGAGTCCLRGVVGGRCCRCISGSIVRPGVPSYMYEDDLRHISCLQPATYLADRGTVFDVSDWRSPQQQLGLVVVKIIQIGLHCSLIIQRM